MLCSSNATVIGEKDAILTELEIGARVRVKQSIKIVFAYSVPLNPARERNFPKNTSMSLKAFEVLLSVMCCLTKLIKD